MKKIQGNLVLDHEIKYGEISFDSSISEIKILSEKKDNASYIFSGFTDLHVHGGGGRDIMEANNAVEVIAKTHLKFGTTSFLATTMTDTFDAVEKAFLDLKPFFKNQSSKHARMLGVHLEGPFISAKKLGAQPDFAREATLKEITHLHQIVPIKTITLAPEVFSHMNLISEIVKLGITVQIGHTTGTYEEGVKALDKGAQSFTHLFNAMSSFHHREPGITGAALAHAKFSEIIPDLLHVHPGAIKVAHKCIENLYYVTDSTAATGMPDGEYKLGLQKVHKCLGGVRLADGTLAGSCLTMIDALKNMTSLGYDLTDTSKRLSFIPNQLIQNKNYGKLEKGYISDLLIIDDQLNITEIFLAGEKCDF